MKIKPALFFAAFIFLFSHSFAFAKKAPRQEPDVVLLVSPIRVKALQPKSVVDAIENPEIAAEPKAVVVFKIERIIRGTLPQEKVGGPSATNQASTALKDKDFLKVLTTDFENPNRMRDKQWISVAVADPAKTFQISSWEEPGNRRYKIRLRPEPGRKGSYTLV